MFEKISLIGSTAANARIILQNIVPLNKDCFIDIHQGDNENPSGGKI